MSTFAFLPSFAILLIYLLQEAPGAEGEESEGISNRLLASAVFGGQEDNEKRLVWHKLASYTLFCAILDIHESICRITF